MALRPSVSDSDSLERVSDKDTHEMPYSRRMVGLNRSVRACADVGEWFDPLASFLFPVLERPSVAAVILGRVPDQQGVPRRRRTSVICLRSSRVSLPFGEGWRGEARSRGACDVEAHPAGKPVEDKDERAPSVRYRYAGRHPEHHPVDALAHLLGAHRAAVPDGARHRSSASSPADLPVGLAGGVEVDEVLVHRRITRPLRPRWRPWRSRRLRPGVSTTITVRRP